MTQKIKLKLRERKLIWEYSPTNNKFRGTEEDSICTSN